jgi:hypothetical protein
MQRIDRNDLVRANAVLQTIPFYPADEGAQSAVCEWLAKTCPHREALEWLTATVTATMAQWGGIVALRDLLTRRYRAADGAGNAAAPDAEAINWSRYPSHETEHAVPPADLARLSAGEHQTAARLLADSPAEQARRLAEADQFRAELLGPVVRHFDRVHAVNETRLRSLERQLAADIAATGRVLSDAEKAARLAETEAGLARLGHSADLPGKTAPEQGPEQGG